MSFRQVTVSGYPALALRGAEIEVVVVPVVGMKLTNLRRPRGREWLWRSDQTPLAPGVPGASYVETADSGGWDECFPTVAPCPMPGRSDALPLPDHGELWSARWESAVSDHAGGTTLTGSATSARFPCAFERAITVDAHEPVVRFRYRLRHLGGEPFPWIWSAHPLFNVQPGTTLELPGVTQVRVDSVLGRPGAAHGDAIGWPEGVSGESDRFTVPHRSAEWAMKLFADIGPSGRAILTDPRDGEQLEIRADPATVPQVGIWINCGGWAPEGRRPYFNLGVEPCIGAPDRLDQAVEEWHAAQQLAAGEERSWSLEVVLPAD
jgi:galactose mutarotase-like enzyme